MNRANTMTVYTLGQGPRGRWKKRLETQSLIDALACAKALQAQGEWPAIDETATYALAGEMHTGDVTFWWAEALNDTFERKCFGRGQGWSTDYEEWVEYDYPSSITEVASITEAATPFLSDSLISSAREAIRRGEQASLEASYPQLDAPLKRDEQDPDARYVEEACHYCGIILPLNQMARFTEEIQTGRVTGSHRTHRSTRSGHSFRTGGGTTNSSGSSFGSSQTSGRAYYRNREIMACQSCYRKNKPSLMGWALKRLWNSI